MPLPKSPEDPTCNSNSLVPGHRSSCNHNWSGSARQQQPGLGLIGSPPMLQGSSTAPAAAAVGLPLGCLVGSTAAQQPLEQAAAEVAAPGAGQALSREMSGCLMEAHADGELPAAAFAVYFCAAVFAGKFPGASLLGSRLCCLRKVIQIQV
jgi:hypothetical protein